MSPDPLFAVDMEKCIESIIECNLYQYTGNNPVMSIDNTGTAVVSLALDINAPAITGLGRAFTEFVTGRQEVAIDGASVKLNISYPGSAPGSEWGLGLAFDTVIGGEVGVENKTAIDNKSIVQTVKNFGKSLLKTSFTGEASINFSKPTSRSAGSGISDTDASATKSRGNFSYGGGALLDNKNNVVGGMLKVGVGYVNAGATVDRSMVSVGFDADSGFYAHDGDTTYTQNEVSE